MTKLNNQFYAIIPKNTVVFRGERLEELRQGMIECNSQHLNRPEFNVPV